MPGFFAVTLIVACIWHDATVTDELQTHAGDFDLIAGQFPHHGPGYWNSRAAISRQQLERNPKDISALNELGAAQTKLGQLNEALATFERLEQLDPKRYETLSNLGVLHKKRGSLDQAIAYTRRALAIKPAGHLGLGSDYVSMLEYRQRSASKKPTTNYLGEPYAETTDLHGLGLDTGKLERVTALIRADRTFPDAIFVFGDHLCALGKLNLCHIAYLRAKQLGHPRTDLLDSRIDQIYDHWAHVTGPFSSKKLEPKEAAGAAIQAEFAEAQGWVDRFQKVEAELLSTKKAVDFEAVSSELKRRGIKRTRPSNHGLMKTIPWGFALLIAIPLALALSLGAGLWLLARRRRRKIQG